MEGVSNIEEQITKKQEEVNYFQNKNLILLKIVKILLQKTEKIEENLKKKDFEKFMKGRYNFEDRFKLKKQKKVYISVFEQREHEGKMVKIC